jgi:hypothetical protein
MQLVLQVLDDSVDGVGRGILDRLDRVLREFVGRLGDIVGFVNRIADVAVAVDVQIHRVRLAGSRLSIDVYGALINVHAKGLRERRRINLQFRRRFLKHRFLRTPRPESPSQAKQQ